MKSFFSIVCLSLQMLIAMAAQGATLERPCDWQRLIPGHRSDQELCHISYSMKLEGQLPITLCISRGEWKQWLNQNDLWCGSLQGKWQLVAQPMNLPESQIISKPVRLIFRVTEPPHSTQATPASNWLNRLIHRLETTRENVSESLKPWDNWGILRSLLLGESTPGAPIDLLRLLGFVHLAHVSGIHLYLATEMLGAMILMISEFCEFPQATALLFSRVVASLFCIWAWWLAGCSFGILRAVIIRGTRFAAKRLGVRGQIGAPVVVLVLINLLVDNHGSGLQYDFAVWGGYLGFLALNSITAMAFSSWAFTAVIDLFRLHLMSLYTPVFSLITVPVICGVIYPGLVLESAFRFFNLPLSFLASQIFNDVLSSFNFLVRISANFSIHSQGLWMTAFTNHTLGLLAALSFLICVTLKMRALKTVLLGAFFLLIIKAAWIQNENFKTHSDPTLAAEQLTQLDVGQGDAALIEFPKKEFGLIDVGSKRALGEADWIRILASQGARQIDWVLLTHLDEDHRGGLEVLSKIVRIRCVATSKEELATERGIFFAQAMHAQGVLVQTLEEGCLDFPDLGPKTTSTHATGNNNSFMSSALIPVHALGYYLIAGDAEGPDEVRAAQWANLWITSHDTQPRTFRILKISHHGSNTSTLSQSLDAYRPNFAVISSGVGNPYGHPTQAVLARLREREIPTFRIDESGAFRAAGVRRLQPSRLP